MKYRLKIILIILLLSCKAFTSFGWGKEGHAMAAKIAKAYVTKSVLDSVNKYLGDMTWEVASSWMDELRSEPAYDYMKTWHYINIDKDKTYLKSSEENIITASDLIFRKLQNRSKETKEKIPFDVKILFHLMGDMHMPLHVGYGVDRGGNTIKVNFFGKNIGLHQVWDYGMIEKNKSFDSDMELLINNLSKDDVEKIQSGDFVSWLNEGRALLPQIYNFKNNKITNSYIKKNMPYLEKQILNAGLRLAGLLNKIFS